MGKEEQSWDKKKKKSELLKPGLSAPHNPKCSSVVVMAFALGEKSSNTNCPSFNITRKSGKCCFLGSGTGKISRKEIVG